MAEVEAGFRSSDAGASAGGSAPLQPAAPPAASDSEPDASATDRNAREITQAPKIGESDDIGQKIEKIFWSTKLFVIYQAGGQVRYLLPENYDVAKQLRRRVSGLGGLRSSIEDLKEESCIDASERARAASETAWALSLAFEDEGATPSTQPMDILTRVDARLRSLVESELRKLYVFANLAAFCGIEVVLLLALLINGRGQAAHWSQVIDRYLLFCTFGALGAFLSVIIRVRSINMDMDLSVWEYTFTGVTRILIGVIGAVVVALALDSHLVDPTFGLNGRSSEGAPHLFGSVGQPLAMYLIFSFIAGFSESLVPNILRQGEGVVGTGSDGSKSGPIVDSSKT